MKCASLLVHQNFEQQCTDSEIDVLMVIVPLNVRIKLPYRSLDSNAYHFLSKPQIQTKASKG